MGKMKNLFFGIGKISMSGRQINFHCVYIADTTVANQLTAESEITLRALPAAGLPDTAVAFKGIYHGPALSKTV